MLVVWGRCRVRSPGQVVARSSTGTSWIVPFLRPDATLIGHSLGGIFLAKYFTENPPTNPYTKLILIAAPYDDETGESLQGFKLADVSALTDAFSELHLLHSTDDPVVPEEHAERLGRPLLGELQEGGVELIGQRPAEKRQRIGTVSVGDGAQIGVDGA